MPRQTKDEKFASHLPETLSYHAKIIADRPRMSALRRAVEMSVHEGTSFLDVGSGTGIWAILAAKLGASPVVAVEIEECLVPVIHKHAKENGVADRIEIICGNIDDVQLDSRFDVIVAEIFAGDVFSEATTRSIIDLRDRYMSKGGTMIPQWIKLWAVPLVRSADDRSDSSGFPVTTYFLDNLRLNYGHPLSVAERKRSKFAAEPKLLRYLDYLNVKELPSSEQVSAEWNLDDVSVVDSVIVYCTAQYAPGVVLETLGSDTWIHEKYSFKPFEVKFGTVRFEAMFHPKNPSWCISVPSDRQLAPQNFSPVFAYTRARMASAATHYTKARKRRISKG